MANVNIGYDDGGYDDDNGDNCEYDNDGSNSTTGEKLWQMF